jgi:hypothetical protein
VLGLSPSLSGLSSGRLPASAIVGRNGRGQTRYSVCPTAGHTNRFGFIVIALPNRLTARPGFDGKSTLIRAEREAKTEGVLRFS